MAPLPWLILLENFAYQQLMKSPTFHRAVETVVKTVHRARYGTPTDELGGTKLDEPNNRFGQHFFEELRSQLGQAEKEQENSTAVQMMDKHTPLNRADGGNHAEKTHLDESAESAWQELQQRSTDAPRQGFMGDYLEALRGQVNQKKPPP